MPHVIVTLFTNIKNTTSLYLMHLIGIINIHISFILSTLNNLVSNIFKCNNVKVYRPYTINISIYIYIHTLLQI